jgi:hypothetical protein
MLTCGVGRSRLLGSSTLGEGLSQTYEDPAPYASGCAVRYPRFRAKLVKMMLGSRRIEMQGVET